MDHEVRIYGDTRAELRIECDGLAVVDVSGLVTLASLALLQAGCAADMSGGQLRSLVVDFRRAVLLVSRGDAVLAVRPALEGDPRIPVANVCAPHDEPGFLAHAWAMARIGLLRAVFVCPNAAERWVRARARAGALNYL